MSDAAQVSARGGPLLMLIVLLLLAALLAAVGKPVPRIGPVVVPPAPEVLRNRHHALGLLAAELGARVNMQAQLPADSLPPANGGVLWVAMPGHLLETARIDEIRHWVEAGGTLVLAPVDVALHEGDPLAALGSIEFLLEQEDGEEAPASEAGDDATPTPEETTCAAGADSDAGGRPFALGDGYFAWADPLPYVHVASGNENADGVLCGEFFCHALRVPLGRGHVLALADATIFDNELLVHFDHALIAQRLLKLQPGTTIWIVYDETVPSLAALVWHYAKPALFSAAIALLLWLLAVTARFGPLQPSPQPVRRRLAEHVEAAGLLLARHGAHRQLWQVVHDAFWHRFLRRHPQARDADAMQRLELIARQTGLTAEDVRKHLTPPATLGELPAALQKIAFLRNST